MFYIWLHSCQAQEEKCFISPNMSACKIARSVILLLVVWLSKVIENRNTSAVDLWCFKCDKSWLLMNVTKQEVEEKKMKSALENSILIVSWELIGKKIGGKDFEIKAM
jgi:hypothetical protein